MFKLLDRIIKLTINQKLWITAILMMVMGTSVIVVGYSKLTRIDNGINYIVNEGQPSVFLSKDIQILLKKSYANFNLYLLGHDKQYKSLYQQEFQRAKSLFYKLYDEELKHQDTQRLVADNVKLLLQKLIDLDEEVINMTEAATAQIASARMAPIQTQLDTLIDQLVQHEIDDIEASSQQLLSDTKISMATIVYGIPLGLIFLIMIVGLLNRTIVLRLNAAVLAMQDVAMKGDLNLRMDESGSDELSALSLAYNTFMVKIQGVINLVLSSSSSLSNESTSLNSMTKNAESQAEIQKDNINEIATSINNMAGRVELVDSNASAAADAAKQANEDARQGRDVVVEAVSSITDLADELSSTTKVIARLGEDSKEITSVISIIRGISEQTNLLALNAAIEAARAGEAGRGFAVVADEVRNLSERIHTETDEIQRKIDALQAGSADAVSAMERGATMSQQSVEMAQSAGTALESITESVRTILEMNLGIADLTKAQKESAAEIHDKTEMLDAIANQSAETSAQVSQVSTEFTIMAAQLKDLVEQFLLTSSFEQASSTPAQLNPTQMSASATQNVDDDDSIDLF